MRVGGDGSGVGDVGPLPESQSTATEGGEGKGDAGWVEGLGEGCESADYCEQCSVIDGLCLVEGWSPAFDATKEVGDAVLDGLKDKYILDMKAGAKADGGEIGCDGRSGYGGKTNFEVGRAYGTRMPSKWILLSGMMDGRK